MAPVSIGECIDQRRVAAHWGLRYYLADVLPQGFILGYRVRRLQRRRGAEAAAQRSVAPWPAGDECGSALAELGSGQRDVPPGKPEASEASLDSTAPRAELRPTYGVYGNYGMSLTHRA
jgi:hypothetical protein